MSDNELKPIAVLRREIGESTWFDWYPIRPGCRTHIDLQKDNGMDYCEVYTRPALTDEQVREIEWLFDAATSASRIIGRTNAKKVFGCYTEDDARMERAMYEIVDKKMAAIREAIGRGERG